jgi:hypothetical protein
MSGRSVNQMSVGQTVFDQKSFDQNKYIKKCHQKRGQKIYRPNIKLETNLELFEESHFLKIFFSFLSTQSKRKFFKIESFDLINGNGHKRTIAAPML